MAEMTYRSAVGYAIRQEMLNDDRVFLIGEDVAKAGGVFEVDARADLEDLEAALEVERLAPEELEEDIDTVGGLVSALAGRVPETGEVIAHPDGWDFEVVEADIRRVKRVRVRRAQRHQEAV